MAEINDAPILDQVREHWQKLAALIVWKATGGVTSVRITLADIEAFQKSEGLLLTHGHPDSLEFRIVTPEEAERLKAYSDAWQGRG